MIRAYATIVKNCDRLGADLGGIGWITVGANTTMLALKLFLEKNSSASLLLFSYLSFLMKVEFKVRSFMTS